MKKENFSPDFIPVFSSALHDENLQKIDCLVLGTIYWYERLKDGICKASNDSIARVVGAKKSNVISNSIKVLERGGYIKCFYKDDKKRNRLKISCIIHRCIEGSKSSHPQMIRESSTDDTFESSTDEQNKNIVEENKNKNNTPSQSSVKFTKLGESILKEFEALNPSCKMYYNRPNQRQACDDLIATYGFDRVKIIIEKTLPKTNTMKFFPSITTPLQLWEKWSSLESKVHQHQSEQKEKLSKYKVAF